MSKPPSGRHSSRTKFEVPLQHHELGRGIWSPRPVAVIAVLRPLRADAVFAPAQVTFLVDTGADITVIPRHQADDLYRLDYNKSKSFHLGGLQSKVIANNGQKIKVSTEGYLNSLTIQLCGIEFEIPYVVAFDDHLHWSILGRAGVIDRYRISVGGGHLTIEATDAGPRDSKTSK